ncbi:hypothetical protein [Duganella caerulea]|uniref:hypothetical protein n=1 Tax=Duganella caerulea TaxID=2885762 RepID=UPI00403823B9
MNESNSRSTPASAAPMANETYIADCIRCSCEQAVYRLWQSLQCGSLFEHWSIQCPECGFKDEDDKPLGEN